MNTSKITNENRKLDDNREEAERRRRIRRILIASTVTLLFLALVTYFSYRIYIEYQEYIDPSNVYGDWIEIGAPPYQTEILTLSDKGVYLSLDQISSHFTGPKHIFSNPVTSNLRLKLIPAFPDRAPTRHSCPFRIIKTAKFG